MRKKRKFKNEKGIALLIVISAVSILTMVVAGLLSSSLTNHQIVVNSQSRLQAYYLAKSGQNLSKMLLHYTKKITQQINQIAQKNPQLGNIAPPQPLYKMFPLSSGLLRMAGSGGGDKKEGDGEETAAPVDDAAADGGSLLESNESILKKSNFLQQDKLKEFLSFDGDFDSEIKEEAGKFSINTFTKMTPTSPGYDLYKKILLETLMQKEHKTLFENQDKDAEDLVHALADWVDANEVINEFEQVERGNESSSYKSGDYPVKNAKMLTHSEMRLVAGMNDDIFAVLDPITTVYHSATGMNVCLGDSSMVKSLIILYTKYGGCTSPVSEEDAELLETLTNEVMGNCPNKQAMASALNIKLGLKSQDEVDQAATAGTAETKQTSSQVQGCKIQFESLLSDANDVFEIRTTGTVGEVQRTIRVVVDTAGNSPATWKTLYYQVQ